MSGMFRRRHCPRMPELETNSSFRVWNRCRPIGPRLNRSGPLGCVSEYFKIRGISMKVERPLIYIVFLIACTVIGPIAVGQSAGSSREPFVLELPGASDNRYTLPVVRIAQQDVRSLKIRVLKPFESRITYGSIIVTLDGEGINRGCTKTSDLEGKVVTCGKREDRLGGYELLRGKNILEITAVDTDKREFYASYVVMLGDKSAAVERPSWTNGSAERFKGRKFAIVVGVSEYKYNDAGLRSLNYADNDARAVADFLRRPEGGSFSASDIKLMVNQDASLIALRSALNETAKRAGPNDLVFIFIAGHGAPDLLSPRNLYFLFYDTKVVDMEKTAFPMDELKHYLDTQLVAERVLVLIDTCHSAGVNQKTHTFVSGRDLEREGDENNISNFYYSKQLYR